jgi:hypothetical protein
VLGITPHGFDPALKSGNSDFLMLRGITAGVPAEKAGGAKVDLNPDRVFPDNREGKKYPHKAGKEWDLFLYQDRNIRIGAGWQIQRPDGNE